MQFHSCTIDVSFSWTILLLKHLSCHINVPMGVFVSENMTCIREHQDSKYTLKFELLLQM